MLFLIFGLSALALTIMVYGLAYRESVAEPEIVLCPCETCETDRDNEIVDALPPNYFCPEVGCLEIADDCFEHRPIVEWDDEITQAVSNIAVQSYADYTEGFHYHNLTGKSNPEDIDYTECMKLDHCPTYCECEPGRCTAIYVGKHRV